MNRFGFVPRTVLRSDPERTIIPGFRVNAVVHLPYGALPWGVPGYYRGEGRLTAEYMTAARYETTFKRGLLLVHPGQCLWSDASRWSVVLAEFAEI